MGIGKRVIVVGAAASLLTLGAGVSSASAAPGKGNGTCVGAVASTINKIGKDPRVDFPGLGGAVVSTIARGGYMQLVQDFCHR
jgi:hypothetical protein